MNFNEKEVQAFLLKRGKNKRNISYSRTIAIVGPSSTISRASRETPPIKPFLGMIKGGPSTIARADMLPIDRVMLVVLGIEDDPLGNELFMEVLGVQLIGDEVHTLVTKFLVGLGPVVIGLMASPISAVEVMNYRST